ncbi:MAG TPA: hypothetical protein VGJ66_10405 [Pyrinomonadaceae bacterium]
MALVKLFWMILAGVCIVVAAVFLLRRDLNTAFVIAALGLVAWFLNYRAQMKAIIAAADLQENSDDGKEESTTDSDDD